MKITKEKIDALKKLWGPETFVGLLFQAIDERDERIAELEDDVEQLRAVRSRRED